MVEIRTSGTYNRWFRRLRDRRAQRRISTRLNRILEGNFGDHHAIGEGIWELRINYGPGYRLYYIHEDQTIIILLCGGDKDSQQRDMNTAKSIAEELRG